MLFGVFGLLYSAMPSDFFINQPEYNLIYQTNPDIEEQFSLVGLARYSSFGQDNMTFSYTSLDDAPDAPQWETLVQDRFLRVGWEYEYIAGANLKTLNFKDIETWVIIEGIWEGYNIKEWLNVVYDGQNIGPILRSTIETYFPEEKNVSLNVYGTFISADIILYSNYTTILDGWDAEELSYSINWEIDFDAMKPDAWNLIAQLVTFQNPDFGLPDELEVITYPISLALWIIIAIIAYTIITRLIPTISGGIES